MESIYITSGQRTFNGCNYTSCADILITGADILLPWPGRGTTFSFATHTKSPTFSFLTSNLTPTKKMKNYSTWERYTHFIRIFFHYVPFLLRSCKSRPLKWEEDLEKRSEIDSYMCVYVSSHLLSACSGLSVVNTENNFKLACRYRV